MSDLRSAFLNAVRSIDTDQPKNLLRRAAPDAEDLGITVSAADLTALLKAADDQDLLLHRLGQLVHMWDIAPQPTAWTKGTAPSSRARRTVIGELLGIDDEGQAVLLDKRPIFRDGSTVISGEWVKWYSPVKASENEFYWPLYRDYLSQVRRWPATSVSALHRATTSVVERLADPTQDKAYQAKGLVVGYVQSGKTANFTGVAAKAIDAGYRLVIVMTGTIELLRAQTQRRMDMELVGRQNIVGDLTEQQAAQAGVDYQDDLDWREGRFLDLGVSEPVVGIRRLSSHKSDYQQQFKTLRIDRIDQAKPLFDTANLFKSSARLAIVKKNSRVLEKLVTDIKANRNAFAEIPVLIIDDESDQASVNTVDPAKIEKARSEGKEVKERKAINQHITSMLSLMPRAQYVGYTATPFANVFVDPSDDVGIFPRDFVIGLDRPAGYMGVSDFHDLEADLVPDETESPHRPNKEAFVRMLTATDDQPATKAKELSTALDMFVLTGAVKLHRQAAEPNLRFRHHTMLVHESVKKDDHKEVAESVRKLWTAAAFASPSSKSRLRALYDNDLMPVTKLRAEPGVPMPPSFDELEPFIGRAVKKITEHSNNPVLVVNSDQDIQREQQALDFDRYDIWRILVGGSKLSRGFTVEGLTITYFRRATDMGDSLTQMGRWFGFRAGYKDLVRLYIAEKARFGAKTVNLYEAFEAIAKDEEAFREQLHVYSQWDGEAPAVRPIDIPPLVQQHLPWLRPTAKNKMFNARLVEQSESPFTASGYPTNLDDLQRNLDIWRPTLAAASFPVTLPDSVAATGTYDAFVGLADATAIIGHLEAMSYLGNYGDFAVRPKLRFYRRLIEGGLLKDFLVVLPQPATSLAIEIGDVGKRQLVRRDRRAGRGEKFGEITDVHHRHAAEAFSAGSPPANIKHLAGEGRGAVLLYLIRESNGMQADSKSQNGAERGLVVAYSVYLPEGSVPKGRGVLRFQARDTAQEDEPTVDSSDETAEPTT